MADVSAEYLSLPQFAQFCDFIADGLTTRQAAKELGKDRVNISKWLIHHANQEQRSQYALAIQQSADALSEDAMEVAYDDSLDIGFDDTGKPFVKGENIQRSRLKVDTLKWAAGKRYPKKYSDRIVQQQEGGETPVKLELSGQVDIGLIPSHIERILGK